MMLAVTRVIAGVDRIADAGQRSLAGGDRDRLGGLIGIGVKLPPLNVPKSMVSVPVPTWVAVSV